MYAEVESCSGRKSVPVVRLTTEKAPIWGKKMDVVTVDDVTAPATPKERAVIGEWLKRKLKKP
jgi:hypothetical protein